MAIENSFLYDELAERERLKHELAIARRIQLASLPQHTPVVKGLDIAGISVPALEVGGDYFDYLNGKPDDLTIIVGDVSGKGTSAALYMSKVQGIMRSLYEFGLSPKDLFIRANQLLRVDMEKQSFITALGVSFNPLEKKLRLARAGHAPLYHYQAKEDSVKEWLPKGIGMGLAGSDTFAGEIEETTVPYAEGDIFLLITDGITEAQRDGGEEYGEEKMNQILASANGATAKKIRDSIVASVNQFTGDAPQHDDLTLVVVKAV
ncbi:MAG: PP2C family protein-serine/threonine phosphatase [Calditrichota bacterium]